MAAPWIRATELWMTRYRRMWRATLVTGIASPVLFLLGLGLGLGSVVDDSTSAGEALGGVSYLAFLGPGLLAAAVMQTATVEATWPVQGAVRWDRQYVAQMATPLRVRDILAGHLAFMAFRAFVAALLFAVAMVVFGAAASWGLVLAVPAAVLVGLAFAAPLSAYSVGVESDGGFASVQRFVINPMFLFSGTFFPVSQLPELVQPLAYATPLYHGVALCRSLALGDVDPLAAGVNLAYLVALVAVGAWFAHRRYTDRLAR
jgi:lipooligosaccharide transport system permease protein